MLRHLFSLSADKLLDIIINSTVWNLVEHPDWITFDACNDSYGKTLKPWHEGQKWFDPGNMVEAQFAWDRKEFMEMVGGDRDVMGDMKNFYFTPLLEKARKFLNARSPFGDSRLTTPNSEIVLHHDCPSPSSTFSLAVHESHSNILHMCSKGTISLTARCSEKRSVGAAFKDSPSLKPSKFSVY